MHIKVDGTDIYCATGGRTFDPAKPVAVFLHGSGMDHTSWPLQARWLAWHGWSVLVPDLPGHGRSGGAPLATLDVMADWIGRLLDAAATDAAALVGHSMGAAIALEAAARLGARITHLALLGSAGAIPVHPALLAAAAGNDPAAFQMMTEWGHGAGAKLGRSQVPGIWLTGAARALLARNRPGTLHAGLAACDAWRSGPAAAARVACPTLLVTAADDAMTPARKGQELARLIKGASVVLVPDSGHMLLQEAPDACLDALIGFLGAR